MRYIMQTGFCRSQGERGNDCRYRPAVANVIGGQFAALKTFGRRVEDMVIREPIAMKAAFGENPKNSLSRKKADPYDKDGHGCASEGESNEGGR